MNIIEKRKSQLKFLGITILVMGIILSVAGIVLICNSGIGKNLDILKLVFGILLTLMGFGGLGIGIFFIIMSRSVQATRGSMAEDNLGKGTVNMNKCENCGAEVELGQKICAKCEENLKP